jgi:hypothetical protein
MVGHRSLVLLAQVSFNWCSSRYAITNVADAFAGRYNAFTCVTFQGEGFTLGSPTEFGVWSNDKPVRNVTTIPPVPGETFASSRSPEIAIKTSAKHRLGSRCPSYLSASIWGWQDHDSCTCGRLTDLKGPSLLERE